MKVMVVWKTVPGKYKTAVEQFLKKGGLLSGPGAKSVARWHVPGSVLGWHLFEVNDMTPLSQHVAEWADVLEIEVYPVVEDATAEAAAKRVYGK